jgi:hypothetical protein
VKKNLFLIENYCWGFQIGIEVVETVSDQEQDKWGPVNPEKVKIKINFFN